MDFSILTIILVLVALAIVITAVNSFRRCPPDKILVVYGKFGKKTVKFIHGGGAFVWPVIYGHAYLSLASECDVYLGIPAARDGKGKVQVSINGSVHEFDAVTDDNEIIGTGRRVKVLEALGGVLLVTAINNNH